MFLLILSTVVTSAGSAFAAPASGSTFTINEGENIGEGTYRFTYTAPVTGNYNFSGNFMPFAYDYFDLYRQGIESEGDEYLGSFFIEGNNETIPLVAETQYIIIVGMEIEMSPMPGDSFTITPPEQEPQPELVISPESHDFGSLLEGYSDLNQFQISVGKSTGASGTLTGINHSFSGDDAFTVNISQNYTLGPGEISVAPNVTVKPNLAPGSYESTLNFFVDDEPAGSINFTVTVQETHTFFFYADESGESLLATEYTIDGFNIEGYPDVPEREGSTPLGWFEEGATEPYDFSQIPTSDVYLYPGYEFLTFDIEFDENGGTPNIPNRSDVPYGTTLNDLGVGMPTLTNYVFANWHTSASLSPESIFGYDTPITSDLILRASYTGAEFALSFDTNGGDTLQPLPIYFGEDYPEDIPAATKTGYTFIGWYDAAQGEGEASLFDFEAQVDGDAIAYAHFEANEYTVTFEPENGEESFSDTGFYDDYFTEPDFTPTRDNYSFMHWSTEPGGEEFDFDSTLVTGDLILYAVWDPDDYTLTFETQGGDPLPSVTIEYGEEYPELPTPTRTGYEFVGWFTGPAGSQTASEFPASETVFGDVSAYAYWTPIEYTLSFDSNGGSEVESVTGDYDSTFPEPEADPTRTGYTFDYWYVEDESTEYDFSTLVTGDLELTAKWTPLTYNVIFVENGGPNVNNTTVNHDDTFSPPEMMPWMGYTFEGWFLDDETFENEYDFSTPATGPVTLFAKWTINEYSLTFDTGGFGEIPSDTAFFQETFAMPEGDPERTGYTFGGWFTTEEFTTEYDFSTPVTGDRTVYALWVPDTFDVTFVTNSDTVIDPIIGTYDQPIEAPEEPTRFGYEFTGWFTDSEFEMMYDFDTLITGDLTLYAKWDLAEFTLTFDTRGGDPVEPDTALFMETFMEPETPTYTGYNFAGWYADEELTTEFDFSAEVSADATAYAKWIPKTYQITLVENGGPNLPNIMGIFGQPIDEPDAGTWPGYVFDGWYTDEDFTELYDFEEPISGAFNLYAKWDLAEYTLTFELNGGSGTESDTALYQELFEAPADPTRTGYTFEGWFADSELTTAFDFSTPATEDLMAYAKWTPLTYEVVYVENGGDPIPNGSVQHDQVVTPPEMVQRTGYTFTGWYTDSGLTQLYGFDQPATGQIILYAGWELMEYTLTFDTGGFADVEPVTALYQELFTQPEDPTRTGYDFGGWFADAEFTTEFNFSAPATMDKTAYAKWDAKQFTVTFVTDSETVIEPVTGTYDQAIEAPEEPTKVGHTFAGWYTDSEFEMMYDFDTLITGDLMLYAKWEPIIYTLTFDTNGGNDVEAEQAAYMTLFDAPADPTRTGYTFAGWFADAEFTTAFDFSTPATEDLTAYASWTANTYPVVFVENGGPNVANMTGTYDQPIMEPVVGEWPGYVFAGWFTDEELTMMYDFDSLIEGPLTLYAKWDLEIYTLTFDSMGGTEVEAETAPFMSSFEMPEPPTRFGYTFAGWFADAELTTMFDFSLPATADDTAYAAWTPLTYTIVFVENGGTNVNDVTGTHDQPIVEPSAPTKVGHVFEGWFTDNDTFENAYDFETLVTGPFNLYAKWSLEEYTLTFDTGGFADVEADTAFYQELFERPEDPTRTGYSFGGWYADAEFTTEFNFAAPATMDAIAYGQWIPNVQTITFETNMGSEIAPVEVNYDAMLSEPEMPTREGFTFDGWYTDAEFTALYDFDLPVQEDFTLYAKWLSQSTELEFNWMGEGSPFDYDADSATFMVPFNLTIGVWATIVQPIQPVTSYEYFRADGTFVTDFSDLGMVYDQFVQDGDYVVVTAEDSNFTMTYYLMVQEAAMDDMYETDFETELVVEAEEGVLANDELPLPYFVVPVSDHFDSGFSVMVTEYPENGALEMNPDGSFSYMPNDGFSGDDTFMYKVTYSMPYFQLGQVSPMDAWVMPTADSNEAMVTITVNEDDGLPYVNGYQDGTFRPGAAVSRQEIAVMMARAMTGNNVPVAGSSSYPDVSASWAKDSVEFMRQQGIMTGMPGGVFQPNGNLTRAQLATMVDRYVNDLCAASSEFCDNMGMGPGYRDVPSSHWAYGSILRMQNYGTIIGFGDGTFRPNQLVTRAEAVTVINRVLGLIPSESYDAPSFRDVPPTHWAYRDIERATRGY